jgi:nanoRNase/pAp phosphatase (c-di-AMP/oligoRNAs hydrolase)
MTETDRKIDLNKLEELRQAAGSGPVLIMTHEIPDPDALASGESLALILKTLWDIGSNLVYSGFVGRAENVAMLEHLTPNWVYKEGFDSADGFSSIALVDTQPGAGNNALPDQIVPDIVFDHHQPLREGLKAVRFSDVRPDCGANVSILAQYLEAGGIVPGPVLSTAIFYGIQADTRGLSRSASELDKQSYFDYLSRVDYDLLIQIQNAGLPRTYFQGFKMGLAETRVRGELVISYMGEIHRPDFVSEMSDLLIRLKEAQIALCMGFHGDRFYLSMRTNAGGYDAGDLVQQIIYPPGRAGGHDRSAGGQVPLQGMQPDEVAALTEARLITVTGINAAEENLVK